MDTEKIRKEKIAAMFAGNAGIDVIYVTSDNIGFFQKNQAEAYAKTLKDDAVDKFTRPGSSASKETNLTAGETPLIELSVKKLTKAISEEQDVTKLTELLEAENAKEEPRKSAVEAIEARLTAIAEDSEINE